MKTVLITGATDGLGKSIALRLNQAGYSLALCGRNQEKMEKLVQDFNPDHLYYECFDITDKDALNAFIQNSIQKLGPIDILINNAGANFKKARVEDIDEEDLIGMFNLNCLSHFRCIKALYPSMKERKQGQIINILSSSCLFDNETMGGYTASKKAMQALSNILTKEALEDNIRVTSFYPGGIDTNFRVIDRPDYLHSDQVALIIQQLIELPEELNVQEYTVRPRVEKNF